MAQESWKRDKEETGCHAPEGLIMCINNCGFFGSPATMNLCSKCYNEVLLLKAPGSCGIEKLPEVSIPRPDLDLPAEVRPAPRIPEDGSGSSSCSAAGVGRETQQQPIRQTNRCASCSKRVGLTGFKCRCGEMFCSLHRYSDKHNCTFDYKAAGRQAIAKANPVVKADKIQRF